jgi:hypothetical protein
MPDTPFPGLPPVKQVLLEGIGERLGTIRALAGKTGCPFVFTDDPEKASVTIRVEDAPEPALLSFISRSCIRVSTDQMDGLCRYAGLEPAQYLLLCALLALVQWRALWLNDQLRPEDLFHTDDSGCLYTRVPSRPELALLLESPAVCQSCLAFYRCLGLEPEIDALLRVLPRM